MAVGRKDPVRRTRLTLALLSGLLVGLGSDPWLDHRHSYPNHQRWFVRPGYGASLPQPKVEKFPYQRSLSKDEQKWIDEQLKRMRLEEKIGQMIMVMAPARFLNIESQEFRELRHHVLENRVGGILLGQGQVYEAAMLINRLQELARFPLLVAAEFEAGVGMGLRGATHLPWNMAVGATDDPVWAERQGEVTAQEARLVGVNVLLAPVVELSQTASDSLIGVRAYGDDPQQVAQIVSAYIRGAQAYGVMATAKYFPGYSRALPAPAGGFPTLMVKREELERVELVPFRAAIAERVGGIMVGHLSIPSLDPTPLTSPAPAPSGASSPGSLPATLSPIILGDVLRRGLNFDGLIFTDSLQAGHLARHVGNRSMAVQAVRAGADVLLSPADVDEAVRALRDAARRGEITEERLNQSVRRILTAKVRLGLAANRFTDMDVIDSVVAGGQLQQIADSIAQRSLTLVRHDRAVIPLKPDTIKSLVHLVVTNADTDQHERQALGAVLTRELQRKISNIERVVIDQCTPSDQASPIVALGQIADVILISLFVRPLREGQPAALPPSGAAIVNQMLAGRQPVIVVSFGSPYLLLAYPSIQTYLCAFGDAGDSAASQRAVARALLGQELIRGKLPVALPGLYPRGHGLAVGTQTTDEN